MPNNQTKALVQGAAMVAIFTLMMILSAYIPFALMLVFLFAPLPFSWYSAKYKRSTSIFIAIVGCILTFLTSGLIMLPFAFISAIVGIIIGDAIRRQKSKLYLFMSSGLAILLSTAVVFLAYVRLAGINMIEIGIEEARKNYEQTTALSQNIPGQSAVTPEQIEAVTKMMEVTVPSTVTLGAFLVAFVLVTLNLSVLKRLGLNVPKFAPFQHMRLPRSILWYYMIVLCINLFVRPESGSTLDIIILNFSYILWVLLILQGISFIHYLISKKGMPNAVKWIATLLALPLSSFMILLGIVDLGFDVRSLVKGKTKE